MERLTKEANNGMLAWYVKNKSGLPEYVAKTNPYREICEKLKFYEDAEEQGLLLRLPCCVDSKLYDIRQDNVQNRKNDMVHELNVAGIDVKFVPWETWMAKDVRLEEIGKTVFFTKEEAEAALEKMNGEEHEIN